MGTTSPDALYYPSDYNQPADVPNDTQKMAASIQAALNAHMDVAMTAGVYTLEPNWTADLTGFGPPGIWKTGKLCVSKGVLVRTGTALTVTDNQPFSIATMPAGYRPAQGLRGYSAWSGTPTGGTANISVAHT